MKIYALAVGTVIAVLVVLHLKATKRENTRWAYPLLLATFPVYYCIFAVFGSDYSALLGEFLVGVVFLAIAFVAYKFRSLGTLLLLATGYIAHAAYDFYHNLLLSNAGTPVWWPEFCGSVDVLLGGYVAYLAFSLHKKPVVA